MSNLFTFQQEWTTADHCGAKENVAAKNSQRLLAMKHPQYQQSRSSLLSSSHWTFSISGSLWSGGKPVTGGFADLDIHTEGTLN